MLSSVAQPPVRYQIVRDRQKWCAEITGLLPDRDGNLLLASVPGPPNGVPTALSMPFDLGTSGITAGSCEAVFVSDTAHDRVVYVDVICGSQAELRGLQRPRGLAMAAHALWVADSGCARVRRFAFPALEPNLDIADGFVKPIGIACDTLDRLYVLDEGTRTVRRFDARGRADCVFDAALAATGRILLPLALAVDNGGYLFVADASDGSVKTFDDEGTYVGASRAPFSGWSPGAVACGAGYVFIADRSSGSIDVFLSDGTWSCRLPAFRGPVTSLAVDAIQGDLLIKTGVDDTYLRFSARSSFASTGRVECGPFDAGENLDWFRAACDVAIPSGTAVAFEVAQSATAFPAPDPSDWVTAPAPDVLLSTMTPGSPAGTRRFIRMRAVLATTDTGVSPVLRNLRAETAGEDYRTYLPAMYARDDEPARFLFRFLQLMRTELSSVEEHIDALPQLLSPQFVPSSQLDWLAGWLALQLPQNMSDDERRALISRAADLWRERGTPSGISEAVEIATGVRPAVVEAFAQRGFWVLDRSSRLGFDTGLPESQPLGMIVPDDTNPLSLGSGCATTIVGSAVVGESGPLPVEDIGAPLFSDSAYRFTVFAPAYQTEDPKLLAEMRRVIEAEKPAHTGYDLCLVRPDFLVGVQATIGIDTIVGGPPDSMRLDRALLDIAAALAPPLGDADRVGQGLRLDGSATLR